VPAVERQEREEVDHAERERDEREDHERGGRGDLGRLADRLVAADDAAELFALLGHEDLREAADGAGRDGPHLVEGEPGCADRPRGLRARLLVIAEAEAVALGLRVVERRAGDLDALAVAHDGERDRRALVGADGLADLVDLLGVVAGQSLAVDRDQRVAGAQLAGGGLAGLDLADARRRLDRPDRHEHAGEDHEREHDVHERPGGDHEYPLPHRLAVVGAVGVLRRDLLRRVHAGDLHVAAERDRADRVLGLAPLAAHDQRREEEAEALDAHADGLGREEVAGLVQDHERGEAQEGEDPAHARTPISSDASSRASESVT
jgi:hypothetical protein